MLDISGLKKRIDLLDYIVNTSDLTPDAGKDDVYYFDFCPCCRKYTNFKLDNKKQLFFCPAERVAGDVITYAMKRSGIDLEEAVKRLNLFVEVKGDAWRVSWKIR